MRLRNVPGSREAIAESEYTINEPELNKGKWKEIFGNDNPIRIEIGMGKGKFITTLAQQNPDINYIGIEKFSSVLIRAIEKMEESFEALHFEQVKIPDNYSGTPAQACMNIAKSISEIDEKIRTVESRISTLVQVNKSHVLSACNRIEIAYGNFDVRKLAACTRDSNIVFHILCGWMATKDALSLQAETENDPNVVCMIDNKTDESKVPPTKLKNPKFAKPFEMYVKMYGLPKYGEFDPTIFVAITYSLLFGAMFGDLGQGLCIFAIGLIVYLIKKIPLAAILSAAGFTCSWINPYLRNYTLKSKYTSV